VGHYESFFITSAGASAAMYCSALGRAWVVTGITWRGYEVVPAPGSCPETADRWYCWASATR